MSLPIATGKASGSKSRAAADALDNLLAFVDILRMPGKVLDPS
jgi:hypothetical protein